MKINLLKIIHFAYSILGIFLLICGFIESGTIYNDISLMGLISMVASRTIYNEIRINKMENEKNE